MLLNHASIRTVSKNMPVSKLKLRPEPPTGEATPQTRNPVTRPRRNALKARKRNLSGGRCLRERAGGEKRRVRTRLMRRSDTYRHNCADAGASRYKAVGLCGALTQITLYLRRRGDRPVKNGFPSRDRAH
jgi:hypothetical protein